MFNVEKTKCKAKCLNVDEKDKSNCNVECLSTCGINYEKCRKNCEMNGIPKGAKVPKLEQPKEQKADKDKKVSSLTKSD